MPKLTEAAAIVSRMPYHDGDGYSWGGETILTIGDRSINFGSGNEANKLANEIAARWNSGRAALEADDAT